MFVQADRRQNELQVLVAVSNDDALIAASPTDDLYLPIAKRLRVDQPDGEGCGTAVYGATPGVTGDTLRSMELAYPNPD